MRQTIRTIQNIALLATSCTLALGGASVGDTEPYTRVSELDNGEVVLEMCERAFAPTDGNGPTIHLVSAIHIADQSFYDQMQRVLETYDSVLFEGVKPAGLDAIDHELSDQEKADATAKRLELLVEIADGFYEKNGRLPEDWTDLVEHSDARVAGVITSIRTDGWGQGIGTTVSRSIKNNEVTELTFGFTSFGADGERDGEGLNADIVRSTESRLPSDKKRKAAAAGIQSQMADALHVSFQLDEMDMTGKGWINADIDIETLQSQLSEMGEDNAMILKLLEGNSFQAKVIGFVLKFIERSPALSTMMKLAMMDMLALAESSEMMAQMDAMQDVILHGRNDIVIDYLKAELNDNPNAKSIAIFYGAAHMPGIEETIVNDMGYTPSGDTWAPAMSVNIKDTGMSERQINMMRKMIKDSLENQF